MLEIKEELSAIIYAEHMIQSSVIEEMNDVGEERCRNVGFDLTLTSESRCRYHYLQLMLAHNSHNV